MARRFEHVSFLSDLGRIDESVGVVHAVLADRAPHVRVIDLTHDIAPFDVRAGSLALVRSVQYLPDGVVIAAVDAAGSRPSIAIEVAGGNGVLLGPDNGLLAAAVAFAGGAERAVVIGSSLSTASPGSALIVRDVLAPAAAHLCNGGDVTDLGAAIESGDLLPGLVPLARHEEGELVAEVVWVDRFGNAQLNVGADDLGGWPSHVRLAFGDDVRSALIASSFADLPAGISLVLDSFGMYAVAVARHSAASELGLYAGAEVRLQRSEPTGASSPVALRPR